MKKEDLRIVFMGTPEYAKASLQALVENNFNVVGVFSQPDKPKGRGMKLVKTPTKEYAEEKNIPVYQPLKLKNNEEVVSTLEELNPDLIVVVAYGKILPKYILDFPKFGCINVHGSILPKYRGAAPIQWSVINGETKTGVTSMLMEKGLDTGDMLIKGEVEIGEYETASELHDRLMIEGARVLLETVDGLEKGSLVPEKQDDALLCYAPMLDKELALIDWSKPAREIINLIRGMNSWPVAHTVYNGERMRVYRAVSGKDIDNTRCGEIIAANENGIEVICGDSKSILLQEVQFSGSKAMSVREYLNGHEILVGEILG